jgi:ATP-binding cassette, subfamily B, bacterial
VAFDLRSRLRRSEPGYGDAVRILWDTSRSLSAGVAAYTVAASLLPNLVWIFAGRLVGDVRAATRAGLSSPAGHHMFVMLGLAGLAYAAALVLGPIQSALSSTVKWRVIYNTQGRLIAAVSGPVGISHLEDAGVLNDLALAQGQLVNQRTADAPMTLATVISNRASGLFACVVLASFRWWLGMGMALLWVLARRPQLAVLREQGRLYSGASETLRRAWYLQRLAADPAVAKESRVFGLGGWLVDRYRSQFLLGMSEPWVCLQRQSRVVTWLAVPILAAFAGACGYLGYAGFHHQVSLGTLAVMLPMLGASTLMGEITWDDVALSWQMQGLPRIAGLETTLGTATKELAGRRDAQGLPSREVRFAHVRFRYPGSAKEVFDDLELVLPAGRSTALVGINGAGKTTLVKLLARLQDPTGGRILVDGAELSTLDARSWQRQVAVLFQDFARYPLPLRENIGWGAPEHMDDADGLATAASRAGSALTLPEGAVLSRKYPGGVDLSGGQWQRVALARALFAVRHVARILVLDEPTAWLDARGEAEFFERFLEITEGITSLIISHRFSTVRQADHICVLSGGRVTERGDHGSLLAEDGLYAELFRLQAVRYEDEQ